MIRSFLSQEKNSLFILALLIVLAGFITPYPEWAMWFGFALAGYSAIANDSIQTLGTFLTTNRKRPWWLLWLFVGGILVATFAYGYFRTGTIHFDRLKDIPQPTSLTFLQLLSPLVLIVLTRFKMPVSTSFLLLSTFSGVEAIQGMLTKTLLGYVLAFGVAYALWFMIARWTEQYLKTKSKAGKGWVVFQWVSTGFLWNQWLMQDSSNIAVFIPRQLELWQVVCVSAFLFLVMGFLMWRKGGRIQEVVTEKKDINDIRSATMIDLVYAFILLFFKELNHLPMSTTWIFLGLLAGRELALTDRSSDENATPYKKTLKMVGKDILRAGFGLGISLALALMMNVHL